MKALIKLHFQHEALSRFIENVLQSTLSYRNETSKECIQFLNELSTFQFYQTVDLKRMLTSKSPFFVLKRRTCITQEPGERQLSESKPSFDKGFSRNKCKGGSECTSFKILLVVVTLCKICVKKYRTHH